MLSEQRPLGLCLSNCSGSSASVINESLLDKDSDHVLVFFVQDPHDISNWESVIHKEIGDGDRPFRDRVKGCRIRRARKYLGGDTKAVSFHRFGKYHGGLS
jgi:hypothetical protein